MDAGIVGLAEIPIRELNERYLATSLDLADELLQASGKVSKLVVVLEDASRLPGVLSEILVAEGQTVPLARLSRMQMKNPPHPGLLVRNELEGLGILVAEAAKALGVTRQAL